MNRRRFLMSLAPALLMPAMLRAESLQERIIDQLKTQGFSRVEISKTWLGRVRFIASGPGTRREIILNPRTGEILRDLWTRGLGGDGPELLNLYGEDGQGTGGGDEEDDGDGGDREDEDDEDDNSGPSGDDDGDDNSGPSGGDEEDSSGSSGGDDEEDSSGSSDDDSSDDGSSDDDSSDDDSSDSSDDDSSDDD
jgi:hypothetical protein